MTTTINRFQNNAFRLEQGAIYETIGLRKILITML